MFGTIFNASDVSSVLLDVQANLPETSPFLSAQMASVSTFFQLFVVLGMYNFDNRPSLQYLDVVGCKQLCQKTTLKNMAEELLGGGLDIDGKAFESDQIIRWLFRVHITEDRWLKGNDIGSGPALFVA